MAIQWNFVRGRPKLISGVTDADKEELVCGSVRVLARVKSV